MSLEATSRSLSGRIHRFQLREFEPTGEDGDALIIAAMLVAILKNKVADSHLGTERILCAKNCIEICHRLGEAGHMDTHTDTDARRVSSYELRN